MTESDTVERPGLDGRPRQWHFSRQNRTVVVDPRPRISVNEVLTTYRLVLGGAGLGIIFDHLCVPKVLKPDRSSDFCRTGQYLQWRSMSFSLAKKIISPTVRVFVNFLKEVGVRDKLWKKHPL